MKKKKIHVPLRLIRNSILSILFILITFFLAWLKEDSQKAPELPKEGSLVIYTNHNGDDLQSLFRTAIVKAESSVLLMVYSLTDNVIIDALNAKSQEGVDVKVITDGKAAPFLRRFLDDKIDLLMRFDKGIMHLKILVVDEQLVWIGSANMTRESLRLYPNLVLGIDSPPLADYIKDKAAGMVEEGKNKIELHRSFPLADDHTLQLWFFPDNRDGPRQVVNLISSAKKSIKVALFTWTRQDFAEVLLKAMKRGVKVETVIDFGQSHGVGAGVVKFLKQEKIPVRLSRSEGVFHHKMMIVDDEILLIGSANWTKAAFTKNDDCFVILMPLTEIQKEQLDQMWNAIYRESKPI